MHIRKNLTIMHGIKKPEGERAFCTMQGCEGEGGKREKNKKLVLLDSEVSISEASRQIASIYLCKGRRYSASERGKTKARDVKKARATPPLRHDDGLVTQDPDAS
jgi:hypothetical protein